MEHRIKVIENFLDNKDRQTLLKFCENNPELYLQTNHETEGFWSNRTLPIFGSNIPTEIKNIGWDYLTLISQNISLAAGGRRVWCDNLNFVKWWDGYVQHPHADGENPDGSIHPFPWRAFGCVYYLNDDYDGGEIWFPNFGIEIKPKPNMLAFFPGDVAHLHGVRNTTNGVRYTLASFWGFDESKKLYEYVSRNS